MFRSSSCTPCRFFYYWYVVAVYALSEQAAYHLSELIEDHAYATYDPGPHADDAGTASSKAREHVYCQHSFVSYAVRYDFAAKCVEVLVCRSPP